MNINAELFGKRAREYADSVYWRGDEEAVLHFFRYGSMLVGGVGGGRVVPHLKKWHITAVDISPEMVAECRKKGIEAEVMDIQRMSFVDDSFDNIFLPFHTIAYVDDLDATLRELRRVLKPRGVLVFHVPNMFSLNSIRRGYFGRRYVTPRGHPTWTMSHLDYFRVRRYFSCVTIKGPMQFHDSAYWKDIVLKWLPFFDRSLYFICTK